MHTNSSRKAMDTEQAQCLQHFLQGKNIFLTGSAGTGKSFTVSQMMNCAETRSKKVACTAMTGCAAILLHRKATTLHAFAGIGLAKENIPYLYSKIRRNHKAMKRWKTTDILIIDEVSMLGASLFEKLETLARWIRGNNKPFGGIQLVLVGDFFQLPPIEETCFLFEHPLFETCVDVKVMLQTVYRQKEDAIWLQLLQNIRFGFLTDKDVDILQSRMEITARVEQGHMTQLFSVNRKVDQLNQASLRQLNSPLHVFYVQVDNYSNTEETEIGKTMQQMNIPHEIHLCKDALVMLTWNLDIEKKLVNGSQGRVVSFSENGNPIVKFAKVMVEIQPNDYITCKENSEQVLYIIRQLPLRLSWALSIHKVQGHTLEEACMDLGNDIFECGQMYVALSRIKSLDGVYLRKFSPDKMKVNPKVVEYYKQHFPI